MWWLLLLLPLVGSQDLHLTTDDEGYLTVIQGFATQLQCVLNTCSSNVVWYKDDLLLFNGTGLVNASADSGSYKIQQKVDIDYEKGCSGQCSDKEPCNEGFACVDNQCCACAREDFTLVLKNLTFEDSGRYRCQLANRSELLEFHVEVLESGLRGGFHENISYDYSQCCQDSGISPLCRAMCKPSEMSEHHFDPTSCKTDDYKHFLTCATQNNTRNHVHCCKTQLVPSFCYDFCSGDFQMLRRSHRLCLYYLPEIFECFERGYLPFPSEPTSVQVNAVDHDKLSVCWEPPAVHESNEKYPVTSYTVSYKEIPSFPLFGGEMGIPLLTGDYSEIADLEDGDYEDAEAHTIKTRSAEDEDSPEIKELKERIQVRQKRASIVVITRDSESNTTSVREFAFQHVNTTDTCLTLSDLRSATRYVIVVTATNSFGTSVPSVRALATTNAQMIESNGTIPNAVECCKANGVADPCIRKMCRSDTPSSLETISISTSCRTEWPKVAPCIADQRNHTDCCLRKNVQSDCLPICAGSTAPLGVHSVLCLNLDIHAIYQCIREGYVTHPSSPINVTVHEITESSVVVKWAEPSSNAHLVSNYTLFIRKTEHGALVRQVHNAVSPHTELGLDPDSEYSVSVQAESIQGASLPSTAIIFSTRPFDTAKSICQIGEPMLLEDHRVFICSALNPCPTGFHCVEEGGQSVCCQVEGFNNDADFQECCVAQSVSKECLQYCYFNATHLPSECSGELNRWVQCASQGQDHSRCCEQEAVSKRCLTGCRHPFQVPDDCLSASATLMTCFAARSTHIPAAPKNVRVSLIRHNSATVSWEELDYDVVTFQVDLFQNNTLVQSHNTTVDVLRLEDLSPTTKYKARVTGYNEVGQGPSSWNVTFITLPEVDSEADRPRQPENVRIAWNDGAKVNITWDAVTHRRNDDFINPSELVYHLYYTEAETASSQMTMITSNQTWAVMGGLTRDVLYSVFVGAAEGNKESRSSSVLTLIAQPDAYGLPEPHIVFNPDRGLGFYTAGDVIHIFCTLGYPNRTKHYNLDLSVGPHSASNDHGTDLVTMNVTADSTLDTANCVASDTDGRSTVSMRHILVKYGPVAKMNSSRVAGYADEQVRIVCTVEGFPTPSVTFEKDGKRVHPLLLVTFRVLHGNTYEAVLHLPRVKTYEGIYECVADMEGNKSRDKAEVVLNTEKHPHDPRFYLDCCDKEEVRGTCYDVCLGRPEPTFPNCNLLYGDTFLKCSEDIRDHTDCCTVALVPKQCIPLCAGDAPTRGIDCSPWSVKIFTCFMKGMHGSPPAVTGLQYEITDGDTLKVKWDDLKSEQYLYYVVYYRKRGAEEDYNQTRARSNSVDLNIDGSELYEVAVLAANAAGNGPLVFMNVGDKEAEARSSHRWMMFFLFLVICGVGAVGLYVFRQRRQLPAPFAKLFGGGSIPTDASVAFENPAYVTVSGGNEVEIRGLGRSEWQQQELRSSSGGHESARYSKLDSA